MAGQARCPGVRAEATGEFWEWQLVPTTPTTLWRRLTSLLLAADVI